MSVHDGWLADILRDADLIQFYTSIINDLQVTKIEHFRYVEKRDLSAIGLSDPAIRRLLSAVKKRTKKQGLFSKIGGTLSRADKAAVLENNVLQSKQDSSIDSTVTCLIAPADIKLYEQLGSGSFSTVKRGIWTQNGQKCDVAVKILREVMTSDSGVRMNEEMMREVSSMHALRHHNLVRLFGVTLSQPIMMVVELCEGGAVLDRLRSTTLPTVLSTDLWSWSVQIACGMCFLESKRFIHRDLAARNILLSADEKVAKIGDFGFMRALPDHDQHYVMGEQKKVPFAWCAPESLRKRLFSHASDVWMFGVVLWELFSYGDEPWLGLNGREVLEQLLASARLEQPIRCPSHIYQLVLDCWNMDPEKRPAFQNLCEEIKSCSAVERFEHRFDS